MLAFIGTIGWNWGEKVKLRCYARRCGDQWYAICTDLDIAADGASLEEAKASLVTCVELYLEGAKALSAVDRHRWLARKAPWQVRAQMILLDALHRLRGGEETLVNFVLESDGWKLAHV